jgi:putative transposase
MHQEARSDVFNYVELFYNPTQRQLTADGLSLIRFEQRYSPRLVSAQKVLGEAE